jgi:hypothetical protein
MLSALLVAAGCAEQTTRAANPFQPITLGELVANSARYAHERVGFSATIERAEETSQGTWLYLRDGEQRLVGYVPMSFGGSLREALGEGQMQFEIEVGERKLTPLGTMALEMMPYQISKTRYFDQPLPLPQPGDGAKEPLAQPGDGASGDRQNH